MSWSHGYKWETEVYSMSCKPVFYRQKWEKIWSSEYQAMHQVDFLNLCAVLLHTQTPLTAMKNSTKIHQHKICTLVKACN